MTSVSSSGVNKMVCDMDDHGIYGEMKQDAFSKIKHMAHSIGIGAESGVVYKAMELFSDYRDYKEPLFEPFYPHSDVRKNYAIIFNNRY